MAREYKQTKATRLMSKLAIFDAPSLFLTKSGSSIPVDGKDLTQSSVDLDKTLQSVCTDARIFVLCTHKEEVQGDDAGRLRRAIDGFLSDIKVPIVVLCGHDHDQLYQKLLENFLNVEPDLATSVFRVF